MMDSMDSGTTEEVHLDTMDTINTFDDGQREDDNIDNIIVKLGSDVDAAASLGRSHIIPNVLISCLLETLCSFLEKDSVRAKMLNDAIIKLLKASKLTDDSITSHVTKDYTQDYKHRLRKLVDAAIKQIENKTNNSDTSIALVKQKVNQIYEQEDDSPIQSRLLNEFTDFEFLGSGGFAKVYAVKNELDGQKYAVKKSVFKNHNVDKMLQEVKVLAKLNNPNIVKYYCAWTEPKSDIVIDELHAAEKRKRECIEATSNDDTLKGTIESAKEGTETESSTTETDETETVKRETEEEDASMEIVFSEEMRCSGASSPVSLMNTDDEEDTYKGPHCNAREDSRSESVIFAPAEKETEEEGGKTGSNNTAVVPAKSQANNGKHFFLFIQMELCKMTLRKWIDTRHVDIYDGSAVSHLLFRESLNFYSQLIGALEYLHEKKIVHHDIKPSNIFISDQGIKLADFGLACQYESSKVNNHTCFGTHSYAAPEQLSGGLCNFKSDIYSSGIVLAELLLPKISTRHERMDIILALRDKNRAPELIVKRNPEWGQLIEWTTNSNPKNRPTARLLNSKVTSLITQWNRKTPTPNHEKDLPRVNVGSRRVQSANQPQPQQLFSFCCTLQIDESTGAEEISRLKTEIERLQRRNSELEELVHNNDDKTPPSN
ncbi:eukaryotic translation initiation factor 2-alpha kinase 1-like isoform X2 [Cloeon dipterum]|uniref:eukaryotic translation initiation factor 2-alpha kinase 1-like isoform X2 n=1 Tax=Cloeon dipterum TaxID=197152 RepID=UPI00321FCDAC